MRCKHQWISVDDELPRLYQDVLIFTQYKNIYMGERRENNPDVWHIFFCLDIPGEIKVTHWMPLPEPPK